MFVELYNLSTLKHSETEIFYSNWKNKISIETELTTLSLITIWITSRFIIVIKFHKHWNHTLDYNASRLI